MSNKVFVTNMSGYEYESAEKFGDLVYVTQGFIKLDKLDNLKKLFKKFIDSASAEDYLLLSGNTLVCALAVHLWMEKFGTAKVLHWNFNTKEYDLYTL